MRKYISILAFLLLKTGFSTYARVKPNSLFTDHMVLQQGVDIPIWGQAAEHEHVTVSFAGMQQQVDVINGKWMVRFPAMKASFQPYKLIIKSGQQTITINDILIGEVWLCSGQSNMAFTISALQPIENFTAKEQVLKEAHSVPTIRQFTVPLLKSTAIPSLLLDSKGKWLVCDSNNVKKFTAVGYFFARDLYYELNVPIGIMNISYGGTAIENWMNEQTLQLKPEWKSIYTNFYKQLTEFPGKLAEYQQKEATLMAQFQLDSIRSVETKAALPRKPGAPLHPAERGGPTGLWNTMIAPLIPFPFKGCVWYQGEANASRARQYKDLLPAMILSWRNSWGMGDFPFIIIQLPGWKNHYPELREAQWLATQNVVNTSMVVTTDCDDTLDVHPGNKEPVGKRAALQALALTYAKNSLEYMGPVYQSLSVKGSKAWIQFSHTGRGLHSEMGALTDFEIAGKDKKFYPAKADIQKKKYVVVWADAVKEPVYVRLGWRICPQINLYNQQGLCAASFRTDIEE